jgi:hypothetical protein
MIVKLLDEGDDAPSTVTVEEPVAVKKVGGRGKRRPDPPAVGAARERKPGARGSGGRGVV